MSDAESVRTDLAVILAAGEGSRFGWDDGPKPLVRVLGLTLAERVVDSCLAVGVERFVFVLGHRSEEIQAYLEPAMRRRGCTAEFVVAEHWERGNGASALSAAPVVQERSFLLLMCDHLVSEAVLSSVLDVDPGQGGVCLAVDFTRPAVLDPDGDTRAVVADGRVLRLGKGLEGWDGTDTGVFHCSQGLFDGLGRAAARGAHSLTDGMNELSIGGHLAAVDVTGEWWLDVDTSGVLRDARRLLLRGLVKPLEDGFVARYLNRPLSTRISARLSVTSITPDQMTVLSFGIALAGAVLFALGGLVGHVSGAVLVLFASVVDGCDG
jgi:CDP-L-myo-inositol myo-inositolphosphotransferase